MQNSTIGSLALNHTSNWGCIVRTWRHDTKHNDNRPNATQKIYMTPSVIIKF
jgi:hypothetical protein